MKRNLQILNQKDLAIQNLQAQLAESTHTVEQLSLLQTQLQNLQHRYSLLQNENLNSKCMIQSKTQASEKTISHLKSEIHMLENQLRDKQVILSDYQHEGASLKDQKLHRDNQSQMIRYEADGLKSDGEGLTHELGKLENTRFTYQNQLREIQSDLVQLEQTKLSINQKISNGERQKQSLKIDGERLTTILGNYQKQNLKLNYQLKQMQDQEKANITQTSVWRQKLVCQQVAQTELQNRLSKARNDLDQTQIYIREQKDRAKQIMVVMRNKTGFKDSLNAGIQNEQKQINFLITKNGQIADINQKLKNDSSLCEVHLLNLKGSVESQRQLLERLKREDQKIVEIIQNRTSLKESRSHNKLSISRTTGFNFA